MANFNTCYYKPRNSDDNDDGWGVIQVRKFVDIIGLKQALVNAGVITSHHASLYMMNKPDYIISSAPVDIEYYILYEDSDKEWIPPTSNSEEQINIIVEERSILLIDWIERNQYEDKNQNECDWFPVYNDSDINIISLAERFQMENNVAISNGTLSNSFEVEEINRLLFVFFRSFHFMECFAPMFGFQYNHATNDQVFDPVVWYEEPGWPDDDDSVSLSIHLDDNNDEDAPLVLDDRAIIMDVPQQCLNSSEPKSDEKDDKSVSRTLTAQELQELLREKLIKMKMIHRLEKAKAKCERAKQKQMLIAQFLAEHKIDTRL